MSMLDTYKRDIVNFFEIALNIYPKDSAAYKQNRLNPQMEIIPADELSKDYYRIQYCGMELKIKSALIKTFIAVIESVDRNKMFDMAKLILSQNKIEMKLIPIVPLEKISTSFDETYWGEVVGVNFESIDKRFDGAHSMIEKELEHMARLMTKAAEQFAMDDTKIKTDDVYFFFNAEKEGADFEIHISPTLVPAVRESNEAILPSREKLTYDQAQFYFGYSSPNKEKAEMEITIADEIMAILDRINEKVREMFTTELPTKYPACFDYLREKINGILIPVICTIRLQAYSEFGGKITNEKLIDGTDANSMACAEIIDAQVSEILKNLTEIPVPADSGIDHYAIEIDSLAIYGRTAENEVVSTVAEPAFMMESKFMSRYSDGLKRIIHEYLKTVKNKSIFSMLGEVKEKEAEEAANTSLNETIPELLEGTLDAVEQVKADEAVAPVVVEEPKAE